MELEGIIEQLKNKCILITGSTGFLAKSTDLTTPFQLRIQPNVRKLVLLVRTSDGKSAMERMQDEVVATRLFDVLREKHGIGFDSFITEKLVPISGDIALGNLGIQDIHLRESLFKEINFVLNVAATTNFYERYDMALNINVLGAKHVLEFAKKCSDIEMLLHVSTAYVADMKKEVITEKPIYMSETLNGNSDLDIDAELELAEETKTELRMENSPPDVEKSAMKELGLKRARNFGWPNTYVFTKAMGEMLLGHQREDLPLVILRPTIITSVYKDPLPGWMEGTRTIDSFITGYAKGNLPCCIGDPELIIDVIPGDMVVNSMIVAMISHSSQPSQFIYHICSSIRNPVTYNTVEECAYNYFLKNPASGKNGKPIKVHKISYFKTMSLFRGYMALKYRLPLEALHVANVVFCYLFAQRYNDLRRRYRFTMTLVDLYEPYVFFKGCFDDTNVKNLRIAMAKDYKATANILDFDPKHLNWENYFSTVHIPGVMKHVFK